jgi:[ribosomal protein S18]-alanine N-acetyltransferase
MRPARQDEIVRLWPAVRASRLMHSAEELERFHETGPWRVRVSDAGEALVLDRWRDHLDLCAIKGLWAAPHRTAELVAEAEAVARAQGFSRLLSPLLTEAAAQPYLEAGLQPLQQIVALQSDAGQLAGRTGAAATGVRRAIEADLEALIALDHECFDEFWRYGPRELRETIASGEAFVAEKDGVLLGYSTVGVYGYTATVGRLAVSPDARRKGLGKTLLFDAAERSWRAGATVFSLCTQDENAASRSLYSSVGLYELPERFMIASKRLGERKQPAGSIPAEDTDTLVGMRTE